MATSSSHISTKQILLLTALSIFFVLFHHLVSQSLSFILHLHNTLVSWLSNIFSSGNTSFIIKETLALLIIPGFLGLIVAGIYWAFKRNQLPYTMTVVWVLWVVLITLTASSGML